MSKKPLSTFEREMQDVKFKDSFEKGYKEFMLAELLTDLMDESHKSVRRLAHDAKLSPTVVQRIRTGKQSDLKMRNFINIAEACGYHLILEKDQQRKSIS